MKDSMLGMLGASKSEMLVAWLLGYSWLRLGNGNGGSQDRGMVSRYIGSSMCVLYGALTIY